MSSYEHVHSGDVLLGHDRNLWRVVGIRHGTPQGTGYALRREDGTGDPVVGYPPAGTEVVIIEQADTRAEEAAAGALIAAGFAPEIIEEKWGWQ